MANSVKSVDGTLSPPSTICNVYAPMRGEPQSIAVCHSRFARRTPERRLPANRAYGMDQDFYPWSPIVTRPIFQWPDDARVALAVIVNLEHWDWEVPAGTPVAVSPVGGPEDRQPAAIPGYRRLWQP